MLKQIALVALVCGGCVVVHDNPPPPPPPPPPQGPPLYRIEPGASSVVFPGQQAGYGITANLGGSYRAVWTGDSPVQYSNFVGTIYTPGSFTLVDPGCSGVCPVESSDAFSTSLVAGGGEQINFNTIATTGIDGIDFVVDTEPVEFNLTIDGVAYPSLVFFPSTDTGAIANPGSIPFNLTTN